MPSFLQINTQELTKYVVQIAELQWFGSGSIAILGPH